MENRSMALRPIPNKQLNDADLEREFWRRNQALSGAIHRSHAQSMRQSSGVSEELIPGQEV